MIVTVEAARVKDVHVVSRLLQRVKRVVYRRWRAWCTRRWCSAVSVRPTQYLMLASNDSAQLRRLSFGFVVGRFFAIFLFYFIVSTLHGTTVYFQSCWSYSEHPRISTCVRPFLETPDFCLWVMLKVPLLRLMSNLLHFAFVLFHFLFAVFYVFSSWCYLVRVRSEKGTSGDSPVLKQTTTSVSV